MAKARSRRSQGSKNAAEHVPDECRLNLDFFPKVSGESPREIVFQTLHELDVKVLKERGYAVKLLRALPVSEMRDVVEYDRLFLRGVLDGTVSMTKEQGDALQLDMQHRRMLDKVSMSLTVPISADAPVHELLEWQDSRHTADNTTIVPVDEMKRLVGERQSALHGKKKEKDDE